MGLAERIYEGLRTVILVNDRLKALGERVERLAEATAELDRRLVRVETAIELASQGRLRPPPPRRREEG
jgi:hypothetical protein